MTLDAASPLVFPALTMIDFNRFGMPPSHESSSDEALEPTASKDVTAQEHDDGTDTFQLNPPPAHADFEGPAVTQARLQETQAATHTMVGGALGAQKVPTVEVAPGIRMRDPLRS